MKKFSFFSTEKVQRDITVITVTLYKKLCFFIKSLKSKKKKVALVSFYCILFLTKQTSFTQLHFISHTRENSKMFKDNFKIF